MLVNDKLEQVWWMMACPICSFDELLIGTVSWQSESTVLNWHILHIEAPAAPRVYFLKISSISSESGILVFYVQNMFHMSALQHVLPQTKMRMPLIDINIS